MEMDQVITKSKSKSKSIESTITHKTRKMKNSNSKKRKLNDCSVDNVDSSNKNEPYRKKRKFNENNNELNALFESNKSLKIRNYALQQQNSELMKQKDCYEKEINIYKREANEWKAKYTKLYSSIHAITNNKTPNIYDNISIKNGNDNDNDSESESDDVVDINCINGNSYTNHKIKSNLKEKYNIKTENVNGLVLNNHIVHPIIIPNNLINQSNINIRLNSIQCNAMKLKIKQEIINEDTKYDSITDRLLEMGFDRNQVTNRISLYQGSGEDPQFVFSQLINTFTADSGGRQLRSNTDLSTNDFGESDSDSDSDTDSEESMQNKHNNNSKLEFENSYHISVNCHICKQHFTNYYKYESHIEKHYVNDPNRQWKQCDLCKINPKKPLFGSTTEFISHLCQHTNDKPFKCDAIINGNKCKGTASTKYHLKLHWISHNKTKKINLINDNNDCVQFENSYYISVDCHVCQKHFDDIYAYKDHIQSHYANDPTKTWRKCDFGCKIDPKKPLFYSSTDFIYHISTHTKNKPYKCNLNVNGAKCTQAMGCKSSIKAHWRCHFKNKANSQPYKPGRGSPNKIKVSNMNSEYVDFENSYHISVHCHICKKHFDNFITYENHIKKHYVNDPTKTWRKCDFGCKINPKKPLSGSDLAFVSHISQHTNDKPFKCDVKINKTKCKSSFGSKCNLRGHWQLHFPKKTMNTNHNTKKKKKRKLSKKSKHHSKKKHKHTKIKNKIKNETIQIKKDKNTIQYGPAAGLNTNPEFENTYYVSTDCHICNKHFDDIYLYRNHIKKHYANNPSKTWLKCDMGCENYLSKDIQGFVCHISSHTKKYPFKCNVVSNNEKCEHETGTKGNLKSHWNKMHNKNKIDGKKKEVKKIEKIKKPKKTKRLPNVDFENSYYVSVHCHICDKHFDEIYAYRNHLKQHYVNDPNRCWLKCDFECKDYMSANVTGFTAHIVSHTKKCPFKCKKCEHETGSKTNLKTHWEKYHNKNWDSDNELLDECSDSVSESDSQSSSASSSVYSSSSSEYESDSGSDYNCNDNNDNKIKVVCKPNVDL